MKKRRIKLVVAYDGSSYAGWQIQNNAVTVQGILNEALKELLGSEVVTIGASRTDAGVHARGNVAVFDTESRIPASKFAFALNAYLPEDIRIQCSEEVDEAFHPRFTDTVKTYEYCILNRQMPDPTRRLYAYFYYGKLDPSRMRQAAAYLEGTHDFRSFASSGMDENQTTIRTIYRTELEADEDGLLRFQITGNGFLYNMVRIIAGTLIEIGNGRRPPEQMQEILLAKDRRAAGATAPARGLTLLEIRYPDWEC